VEITNSDALGHGMSHHSKPVWSVSSKPGKVTKQRSKLKLFYYHSNEQTIEEAGSGVGLAVKVLLILVVTAE